MAQFMQDVDILRKKYPVYNFGVDSLWLNFCYEDTDEAGKKRVTPTTVLEQLAVYQEHARAVDEPVETEWVFDEHPLYMYPHGGGARSPWRYLLRNDALELKIGTGKKTGFVAKTRLMASYLWREQADSSSVKDALCGATACVQVFVSSIFEEELQVQIAEAHLCADLGYDFSHANEEGFIRRSAYHRHQAHEKYAFVQEGIEEDAGLSKDARILSLQARVQELEQRLQAAESDGLIAGPDKVHKRYRDVTGYTFGSHASAISTVIYNKLNYIQTKEPESSYFFDLWQANGWDGVSPVWRVECRITRAGFCDFKIEDVVHGINDAFDFPEYLEAMWEYCTIHFLRYVVPSTDTNRARWETHEVWQVVQHAYFSLVNVSLGPIIRERKYTVNVDRMVTQLAGCLMTYYAWLKGSRLCSDEDDFSLPLHRLAQDGPAYLERAGKDFNATVRRKQHRYRLIPARPAA